MANQIVVSAGAKVRNLNGVLTATSGVVSSVPLGAANGVATLDSGGKVPVSQLPSSVVTYLGTWNAATNTPTLVNGVGDAGDMYICNVAGTVNFGAGPVTFAVGDWVLYGSGTWQKSNGQNGTVTSVAVTESGDSLNITGSPITTSGTINIGFNGTNLQYVNGAGNLTTFPILTGYVPYTGATTNVDLGLFSLTSNSIKVIGDNSTYGGTLSIKQSNVTSLIGVGYTELFGKTNRLGISFGAGSIALLSNSILTAERTYTFPDASGTIALTSDIPILTGYVPYTGATTNVDLGTFNLTADVITGATGSFTSSGGSDTFAINHSSGAGIALNITKGGSGEGLYINKTSGSGNAATIIGTLNATTLVKSGGTSSQFLKADGSVDSSTYALDSAVVHNTGNETVGGTKTFSDATKNNGGIFLQNASSNSLAGYMNIGGLTNGVKFTSGGGISNSFTLPSATGYTYTFPNATGTLALTSDIPSLTGYVNTSGSPTTNYLPKFTGASTIGNSAITDDGTTVTLVSRALSGTSASFISTAKVLEVKQSTAGSATYFVFDNTIETTGKKWRFGYTGGVADAGTFSLYNETDNVLNFVAKGGNLGLGVTPSAWYSTMKSITVKGSNGNGSSWYSGGSQDLVFFANGYYDAAATPTRNGTGGTAQYRMTDAQHSWWTDATTTGAISLTQAMTLTASGRLLINKTNEETYQLDVNGTGRFSSSVTATAGIFNLNTTNGGFKVTAVAATPSNLAYLANNYFAKFYTRPDQNYGITIFDQSEATAIQSADLVNGSNARALIFNPYGGNVLIGTTTSSSGNLQVVASGTSTIRIKGSSTTGLDLQNDSGGGYIWNRDNTSLYFGTNNTQRLEITGAGAATFSSSVSATSFFEVSDKTQKTLIQDNVIINGIENILAKTYIKDNKEEIGYFAQDLQGVLDSSINMGENGLLSLSYRQVHTAKISSLEFRVKELEKKLMKYEA